MSGALGCAEHEVGVILPVTQTHDPASATFMTDRGYTVTLTHASIVVRTVEIVRCAASERPRVPNGLVDRGGRREEPQAEGARRERAFRPRQRGSALSTTREASDARNAARSKSADGNQTVRRSTFRRALRLVARALSPEGAAYAHETQTLDLLSVAATEDLLRGGASPTFLGDMPAWPTAHCAVKVFFGPAGGGHTLVLEGEVSRAGGAGRPFLFTSDDGRPTLISVDAFEPAKDAPRPGISIVHTGLEHWLDGIDLDTVSAADAGAAAFTMALSSLQVRMTSE